MLGGYNASPNEERWIAVMPKLCPVVNLGVQAVYIVGNMRIPSLNAKKGTNILAKILLEPWVYLA